MEDLPALDSYQLHVAGCPFGVIIFQRAEALPELQEIPERLVVWVDWFHGQVSLWFGVR